MVMRRLRRIARSLVDDWVVNLVFSVVGMILLALGGSTDLSMPIQPASDPSSTSDPQEEDPTEIVLLGVSHFAGSALDEYTSSVGDLLSDKRQRELDAVAARLARFAPDQFFVERMPEQQKALDSLYRAYRAGDYDPTEQGDRDEIRQLGFRAAEQAGLAQLQGVDAEGIWLGDQARAVAETRNPQVLEAYRNHGGTLVEFDETFLPEHTLGAWLRALNTDHLLYQNHKAYIYYYARMGSFDGSGTDLQWEGDLGGRTFAFAGDFEGVPIDTVQSIIRRIGGHIADDIGPKTDYVVLGENPDAAIEQVRDTEVQTLRPQELMAMLVDEADAYVGFPDHHIGADLVGEWYKRNLRIYANIWQAVEPDTDRVVVMIGQGHVWTLRQFFRENPDFEVVPVDEVL